MLWNPASIERLMSCQEARKCDTKAGRRSVNRKKSRNEWNNWITRRGFYNSYYRSIQCAQWLPGQYGHKMEGHGRH